MTLCFHAGPVQLGVLAGRTEEPCHPVHKCVLQGCRSSSLSSSNRESEHGACGNGAGARLAAIDPR
jgi:hypothetical protein